MPEPAFDPAALDTVIAATDLDFAKELLSVFLNDSPALLAQLRQAAAAGNSETFRRAAHSLKSNGANFGAAGLAALAQALEQAGKNGALDNVGGQLDEIEVEFQRVSRALETWRDEA